MNHEIHGIHGNGRARWSHRNPLSFVVRRPSFTLPREERRLTLLSYYCVTLTVSEGSDPKNTLVENVEKLLVELGRGFAFVGREYVVATEETEQRIDLLFYLIPQHRYVVVEVKTGKFETSYLGQLAGYVALVNAKLNTSGDNPAIGLLVCKERDATLVRYVLDQVAMPIGVSNYELSQALPNELRSDLPSIEELEAELDGAESSEGGDAGK